ncbi:MAG: hypothetical protein LJF30_22140 [Acidobacteria bacterium]|jgi:hypothetical protein|nr:hypothetical protein [Acidobacteriota bacterium]
MRWPALWILFYLAAMDIGANVFFAYPQDPRNTSPSTVQRYFEYGRSVEGKLSRMTGPTDETSAPIVAIGWLVNDKLPDEGDGRPVVTFYGMSHAKLLVEDIASTDGSLAVRAVAAPLGVPTWSFAAYLHDRKRLHSDVVVLAVMTDTIPLVAATSGTTMYFDGAYPYTWPRYYLADGSLQWVDPPFLSEQGYREFFFDDALWSEYVDWLAEHDPHYDPLLFRGTFLDRSSLVRLLRRSYALATRAARRATIYDDARGFDESAEEITILESIVEEFAQRARRAGSVPMVYIVNSLNTGDRAFRLLHPLLSREEIPFLSSHEICPPNEPGNYLPDSHFVPAKNMELALAMSTLIHEQLDARRPATD